MNIGNQEDGVALYLGPQHIAALKVGMPEVKTPYTIGPFEHTIPRGANLTPITGAHYDIADGDLRLSVDHYQLSLGHHPERRKQETYQI